MHGISESLVAVSQYGEIKASRAGNTLAKLSLNIINVSMKCHALRNNHKRASLMKSSLIAIACGMSLA